MAEQVTIIGNIATDPERSQTQTGVPVVTFRLAAGERRKDPQTGQWSEVHTNWYRVSAYRALADNAAASLRKGERVLVTGRLRLRTWESNGKSGHEAEVDADALGHDLLWGSSSFTRNVPQRQTSPATTAAPDGGGDGTAAEAWTAPATADATPF